MVVFYGRTGRLTAKNGGFWPGQSAAAGERTKFVLPEEDHCLFENGDAVGWYHLSAGVTDYDNGGHDVIWNYPMDHPGLGGSVTFAGGGSRTYSVAATVLYGVASHLHQSPKSPTKSLTPLNNYH
jgi:hypothetical protein